MENEDRRGKKDQVEEHSLPGTNQAGKAADSVEKNDQDDRSDRGEAQQDQLEEHSLPGTNQGGKGPTSDEKNDVE